MWLLACATDPASPNLIVVDIDSLAEHRVGARRGAEPVTPELDRLAARGTRFSHYYSQAGWTLPALSALLTGHEPVPLELRDGAIAWMPRAARTTAEILGLYGYHTAAVWGTTLPAAVHGALGRGFAEDLVGGEPGAGAAAWLAEGPEEPFYLYVHDIDLHAPYPFPTPGSRRWGEERLGPSWYEILARQQFSSGARDQSLATYDDNLRRYDAALAPLLRFAEEDGNTWIFVLSDHGEDLFVHTYGDHGPLYDSTLHAPLIVAPPAGQAQVVDTVVQTVDLAPTLLALAGVPPDQSMDGRSLLPLLGGTGDYRARPVRSLTDGCNASLRKDGWKLILATEDPRMDRGPLLRLGGVQVVPRVPFLAPEGLPVPDCNGEDAAAAQAGLGDGGRIASSGIGRGGFRGGLVVELFDLAADPRETRNLALERPELAHALSVELLGWLAARRAAGRGGMAGASSPEVEAALKEQGYWQLVQPTEPR